MNKPLDTVDVSAYMRSYMQVSDDGNPSTSVYLTLIGILIAHISMGCTLEQTQESLDRYVVEMVRTGKKQPSV